jgi:hypothetical protein
MTAIVVAVLTSCEKEEMEASVTISGTLEFSERYNDEFTKVVIVVQEPMDMGGITVFNRNELARGIYSNGSFSIELPARVDEKYLQSRFTEDIPPKFKVSDKKVKTGIFSISISSFKDMEDLPDIPGVGGGEIFKDYELIYAKSDDRSTVQAMLYYADRKCSITGTLGNDVFSVNLKKGWNFLYETETELINEYSTNPVSGLKWYVIYDFY